MQARDDAPAPGAEATDERRLHADQARLFALLDELGIPTTTRRHRPVFTVAEARARRGEIPGGHCKSLFLKDKKGGLWLVVADEDRRLDLKALAKALGSPRLSFASPGLLREVLAIAPGAVTPFALINDAGRRVRVVLDAAMLGHERLNYHPLANDPTTTITSSDLCRFVAALGYRAYITDLDRA